MSMQGALMVLLKKSMMFALLAVSVTASATPVTIGYEEWRQVTDTTGFSWDQVAQVCDPLSGVCRGSLGETDFTGWNWASAKHVSKMFHLLTGRTGDESSLSAQYSQHDSTWAPTFMQRFSPTYTSGSVSAVFGWSRSPALTLHNSAYWPYVYDTEGMDIINSNLSIGTGAIWQGHGVWLFRQAQYLRRQAVAVPEPATIGLFAIVG